MPKYVVGIVLNVAFELDLEVPTLEQLAAPGGPEAAFNAGRECAAASQKFQDAVAAMPGVLFCQFHAAGVSTMEEYRAMRAQAQALDEQEEFAAMPVVGGVQ